MSNGEILDADAVVLTIPAYAAATLVRPLAPSAAEKLASIRYVTTGTISLAYRSSDIKRPLGGFGLVVPKGENRPINAITVSSSKFAHRGPDGYALLRVFFGGSRTPQTLALDDAQLLEVVREELLDILGIEAAPLFHRIYRWPQGNPQYDVDHLDRVAAIEGELPSGLYVTGSAYRGVGLPDCVHQSQQTAEKLIDRLKQAAPIPTGVPE
jgi:oxygen-dependent protoporphyrinogen oxidase